MFDQIAKKVYEQDKLASKNKCADVYSVFLGKIFLVTKQFPGKYLFTLQRTILRKYFLL